jgi:hypothetical protein
VKKLFLGLLILLYSAYGFADDARSKMRTLLIHDTSNVDSTQYCIYDGKLYTRGIEIETDTGTYACMLPDLHADKRLRVNINTLTWIKKK